MFGLCTSAYVYYLRLQTKQDTSSNQIWLQFSLFFMHIGIGFLFTLILFSVVLSRVRSRLLWIYLWIVILYKFHLGVDWIWFQTRNYFNLTSNLHNVLRSFQIEFQKLEETQVKHRNKLAFLRKFWKIAKRWGFKKCMFFVLGNVYNDF